MDHEDLARIAASVLTRRFPRLGPSGQSASWRIRTGYGDQRTCVYHNSEQGADTALRSYAESLNGRLVTEIKTDDDGARLEVICRTNTVEELSRTMMRPSRPMSREAAEVALECVQDGDASVSAATLACETYEARGLVPLGWFDDSRRRFVERCRNYRCHGGLAVVRELTPTFETCQTCGGRGYELLKQPLHRVHAEIIVSDLPNMAAAEECAIDATALQRAWMQTSAEVVAWRFLSPNDDERFDRLLNPLMHELAGCDKTRTDALDRAYDETRMQHAMRCDVLAYHWFEEKAKNAEVAPRWMSRGSKKDQVLYCDLRNPFEPILGLWRLGYAFHTVERGAAIVLCRIP